MTQVRVAAPRRTGVMISLVVLALIVAGLAWRVLPAIGPWQAANAYCAELTRQHYAPMYQHLSTTTLQSTMSQDEFVAAQTLADEQAGSVRDCAVAPLTVTAADTTASAQVTEQRASGLTVQATLRLTGPTWRLAAWPDPASAPFAIAFRFCRALSQQDYPNAYQLFTTIITGQLNEDDFTTFERLADASSGQVDSCTITHLDLDHASATASVQIHRQHGEANGVTAQIVLAQQTDQHWQIVNLPHA